MTKHENVNTQKLTEWENKRIQNVRFHCHLHARHINGFTFDDLMHIPKPDLMEVFSHWEDQLATGKMVFGFKGVSHDH